MNGKDDVLIVNQQPILLVEDNPDDVELTKRAFRKCNIRNTLVVAEDGAKAIQMLHGTPGGGPPELPALVLLDLKLPKLDGLEVLARIRANPHTHRLPVVILTSSKEEEDLTRGYDLGANSYIRKPVKFEQFVEAVGQVGLYWLVLNQPPPLRG